MVEFKIPAELQLNFKDQWDIRTTQRGVLVMEGGNTIHAEIPAIKGDEGKPGRDGTPPRFHAPVTESALPDQRTLTNDDLGWFWPIEGTTTVYTWNGRELIPIPNYLGQRGATGPAPTMRIGDVQTKDIPAARITTDPEGTVTLNLDLPRGLQGPPGAPGKPGDAGPISSALDYDDGGTPAQRGDVLTMRPDGDWGPARPQISAGVIKKSGADSDWADVNTGINWKGDYTNIVTVTVPAQDVPWEPEVYGMLDARVDGLMVRMDIEARLGAVSGPLLALGPGPTTSAMIGEWVPRQLIPAADETASLNASSTIVPAGQEATIYVIARRVESLSGITFRARKDRAYLRIHITPVRAE